MPSYVGDPVPYMNGENLKKLDNHEKTICSLPHCLCIHHVVSCCRYRVLPRHMGRRGCQGKSREQENIHRLLHRMVRTLPQHGSHSVPATRGRRSLQQGLRVHEDRCRERRGSGSRTQIPGALLPQLHIRRPRYRGDDTPQRRQQANDRLHQRHQGCARPQAELHLSRQQIRLGRL